MMARTTILLYFMIWAMRTRKFMCSAVKEIFLRYSGAGANAWWSSSGFNTKRIEGRIVSGDFDRDGDQDDIAAFYDLSGGTEVAVFRSTGSSFN